MGEWVRGRWKVRVRSDDDSVGVAGHSTFVIIDMHGGGGRVSVGVMYVSKGMDGV